jgi:hypothetical protein
VLPCLARECDCPRALGLLGHSTVVPSSPHSLSPVRAPAHLPRFFSKSARVLSCLFNNRAYVLASRAAFQNPRSCSLTALLFKIRACAPLPHFFSIYTFLFTCCASFLNPRLCSLTALLSNTRAPAHLPRFCLTSALVFLVRLLFNIPAHAHLPRFCLTSALVFLVRLLFNIRSPAHVPRFLKYPRSCSLTALFKYPRSWSLAALLFIIHATDPLPCFFLISMHAWAHLPFFAITSRIFNVLFCQISVLLITCSLLYISTVLIDTCAVLLLTCRASNQCCCHLERFCLISTLLFYILYNDVRLFDISRCAHLPPFISMSELSFNPRTFEAIFPLFFQQPATAASFVAFVSSKRTSSPVHRRPEMHHPLIMDRKLLHQRLYLIPGAF